MHYGLIAACILSSALSACSSERPDGAALGLCGRSPAAQTASQTRLQDGITVGVADPFTIGFEKSSANGATVTIIDADPYPPARFMNAWTIEVHGKDAEPLDNLALDVTLRMSQHDHAAQTPARVTAMGAGRYGITDMFLWMPGLWTVTFVFRSPANEEQVLVTVCIDQ